MKFLNHFCFKENPFLYNMYIYIVYLIFVIICKTLCPSFTPHILCFWSSFLLVLNQKCVTSHSRKSGVDFPRISAVSG